jgi:hypothetical protein
VLLLITPIPGPPLVIVTSVVISAIAGLWHLFSGGVSSNVKRALEGLRGAIQTVGDTLMRFAWIIARALGRVFNALRYAWERVIWPLLRQIPRIIGRLRRLIERDLPRLLRLIERIRQRILQIYESWMRPVLLAIERVRRMLLIFRLLHFKWAENLDRRLRELQGRIMQPLAVVLAHIALVEQWINVIVSTEQLLQETIFGNSLYHYQRDFARSWAAAYGRPLDPLVKLDLFPRQAAVTADQSREHLRLYLQQNTGPIAGDVAQATAETRRQLGV